MEYVKIIMDSGKEYTIKEEHYDDFFEPIGIPGSQSKRLRNNFIGVITKNDENISINPSHISSLEKIE